MSTWTAMSLSATPTRAPPGIDEAYHVKYDRYGPAVVGSVVGADAAPVTIRLLPR
jgi:hypothetical protein